LKVARAATPSDELNSAPVGSLEAGEILTIPPGSSLEADQPSESARHENFALR